MLSCVCVMCVLHSSDGSIRILHVHWFVTNLKLTNKSHCHYGLVVISCKKYVGSSLVFGCNSKTNNVIWWKMYRNEPLVLSSGQLITSKRRKEQEKLLWFDLFVASKCCGWIFSIALSLFLYLFSTLKNWIALALLSLLLDCQSVENCKQQFDSYPI